MKISIKKRIITGIVVAVSKFTIADDISDEYIDLATACERGYMEYIEDCVQTCNFSLDKLVWDSILFNNLNVYRILRKSAQFERRKLLIQDDTLIQKEFDDLSVASVLDHVDAVRMFLNEFSHTEHYDLKLAIKMAIYCNSKLVAGYLIEYFKRFEKYHGEVQSLYLAIHLNRRTIAHMLLTDKRLPIEGCPKNVKWFNKLLNAS